MISKNIILSIFMFNNNLMVLIERGVSYLKWRIAKRRFVLKTKILLYTESQCVNHIKISLI